MHVCLCVQSKYYAYNRHSISCTLEDNAKQEPYMVVIRGLMLLGLRGRKYCRLVYESYRRKHVHCKICDSPGSSQPQASPTAYI